MRTIKPVMADANRRTEITIRPGFEYDDSFEYPAARVEVAYYENERMLFVVSFEKVLSESCPLAISDCDVPVNDMPVVRMADDMLNGTLDEVGLKGLETLDLYKTSSMLGLPLLPDKYAMTEILEKALGIPYLNDDSIKEACLPSYRPPVDGFYNVEIDK